MSAVTFDTLKFVETLEHAKLPREQASAIAVAVQSSLDQALTDKLDHFAPKAAVSDLKKETESQFALLQKDMDNQFTLLRKEMALLRKDMEALSNTITIRVTVTVVAALGAIEILSRIWPKA